MKDRIRGWTPLFIATSVIGVVVTLLAAAVYAQEAAGAAALPMDPSVLRVGYGYAAGATAVSSTAAAFAVAKVGSAAVAAITEKPELFGRMVVLVGLAEGIAIYGLIVSVLILNSLG
ncbi:MAG: ATP synthase subunit C [Myxococcota bacterium]